MISAGYYLYVLVRMFMRPRPGTYPAPERTGGLTTAVLAVTVALILILGFAPEAAIEAARRSRPRMDVEPVLTNLPPTGMVAPSDSLRRVAESGAAGTRSSPIWTITPTSWYRASTRAAT